MPTGPGFSPAFSSFHTMLALFTTVAPGTSRHNPTCPGIPVEQNDFSSSSFFFSVYLFALGKSERQQERGRDGERERENPKQAPFCPRRAQCGARTHELRDHDLS